MNVLKSLCIGHIRLKAEQKDEDPYFKQVTQFKSNWK